MIPYPNSTSWSDVYTEVETAFGDYATDFDIPAIVEELTEATPCNTLRYLAAEDDDLFWEVAQKHDRTTG